LGNLKLIKEKVSLVGTSSWVTMSAYGYGSGGYLTRFSDYYKSSDESEDEHEKKEFGFKKYGPTPESNSNQSETFEESEDEENERFRGTDVDWAPEEKDWVPQSLVDLKLKIKPPKNFKGYNENAFHPGSDDEDEESGCRIYSNDYNEVCKFLCGNCDAKVDTEKWKNHIALCYDSNNETENNEHKKPYDIKTWHKCGICGKALVFTRVRLRYHVITEHNMTIQDYNEEYMVRKGGRGRPLGTRGRRPSGNSEGDVDGIIDPSKVKSEEISDDYADIVKIECRICGKRVEKDNFRFMHLKQHGMDLSDYKVAYGDPAVVKNKYHKCHICRQLFLFTRSRLASHLSRHKVSVKDYGKKYLIKMKSDRTQCTNLNVGEIDKDCMFSNDYEDECSTVCKICERSLNYGNLGSHLYQSHSTRMKDYVEQFGEPQITKKSYHECAICHETLLFIRYQLVTHVKSKHNMSIAAYNKSHMQLHNVEYCDSNIMDKGRKIGTQKAPQWCDGTMYKCPYCFNIYYRYFTFRIHLINSHKMTDTEERSTCVRENEILTDIYRCKICHTQVKRDRMDIEAHLKQAHKTTLKIYSANFENPECKDNPNEIVAKLVRMGVLEEPNDKICKTPRKLKNKNYEQSDSSGRRPSREIFDRMNNTVANSSEQMKICQIKSETVERDEINERLLAENTRNRISQKRKLPSYPESIESFEKNTSALSLENSSFLNQVSNITKDPLSLLHSPNSMQSRSNESTSSFQKSLNENDHMEEPRTKKMVKMQKSPSGEDGESIVYRCPLYPCTWTCGKEGMRQGPAVLHLLRIHKIQPLEMRERGIKFDKLHV